jgi:hypothetical protein
MIKAYGGVYAGAWRYMLACPLLFAVPVLVEFVQHVIEMRIGMYDGIAAAQAVEMNGARLGWGVIKALSITLATFWVARFLLLPGGAAAARRADPVAVRLYFRVMLWSLGWTVLMLWGGVWMQAAGLGAYTMAAGVSVFVINLVLSILLCPWMVGAALGDEELGFVRSIGLVGWGAWWGIVFGLAAVLPPMVVHYALSILAIFSPPGAAWAILAVDALVVGCLAAVIAATNVAIARRAAGDSLGTVNRLSLDCP